MTTATAAPVTKSKDDTDDDNIPLSQLFQPRAYVQPVTQGSPSPAAVWMKLDLAPSLITTRRARIHDLFVTAHGDISPTRPITPEMVQGLYKLYDHEFLLGELAPLLAERKITVECMAKTTSERVAGYCRQTSPHSYVLNMSQMLTTRFTKADEKSLELNGLRCTDRVGCLQLVLEHELVHLLVMVFCPPGPKFSKTGRMTRDIHGTRFKGLVKSLFGHTACTHMMNQDADTLHAKQAEKRDERDKALVVARATVKQEAWTHNARVKVQNPKDPGTMMNGRLVLKRSLKATATRVLVKMDVSGKTYRVPLQTVHLA